MTSFCSFAPKCLISGDSQGKVLNYNLALMSDFFFNWCRASELFFCFYCLTVQPHWGSQVWGNNCQNKVFICNPRSIGKTCTRGSDFSFIYKVNIRWWSWHSWCFGTNFSVKEEEIKHHTVYLLGTEKQGHNPASLEVFLLSIIPSYLSIPDSTSEIMQVLECNTVSQLVLHKEDYEI